jgi:hypothetical protein
MLIPATPTRLLTNYYFLLMKLIDCACALRMSSSYRLIALNCKASAVDFLAFRPGALALTAAGAAAKSGTLERSTTLRTDINPLAALCQ